MKKGDQRRQTILETAERLFFDKGYEETSIQDILDELKLSKGGFYHHFESKLQLLEAICEQRAEAACGKGLQSLETIGNDPVARLNALFREGGFFGEENVKYVALLLKTAYGGEILQLRDCIRRITLSRYSAALRDILLGGLQSGIFYLKDPDATARLLLLLACDVNDEIAQIAAHPQEAPGDMGAMATLLETYRLAVELIINAPYGSVDLIDIRRMEDVLRSLRALGVRRSLPEGWNQQA